ncbi:alcohol dehydrogenase catalytic domain-containing protein [Tsukamurella paurometabola]|uniref:Zinc-binding dehydrogenase n=1 Tax=Tsukamurella paurometabola TaxID=2061 RepID=A0ABS5N812_TSUPA|nr:zinc-binding dehydrogenase [Tsukamurella paurometabola]MBS4100406.1 zinc-binding dehydrogenase [Tsukamurella paurometabola]
MQAVHVRPGGVPAIVEIPVPDPRPGEVLVRIAAAAVNPVDAFTAAGGPRDAGWVGPDAVLGLGWDLAGEVVAAGDGAAITPGTRVAAIVADPAIATFAQYVALPAADVAPIPDGIGTVDAAALPLASLTAAQALDLAGEPAGDLLITGAAGAVGGFAVPLAVRAGWSVTGLARSSDAEGLRALGAAPLADLAGGYDAALDTASIGEPVAATVRGGGTYIAVLPGTEPRTDRIRSVAVSVRADGARLASLFDLAAQGVLVPHVRATVPLARFDEALAAAAMRGARGKVVVVVA